LWQAANDQRRLETGIQPIHDARDALARPGAFAIGIVEGHQLLSMAMALPALADDGRSLHNVPGLAHISSVATQPGNWGQGLGGRAVRAIMAQASRRGYARAQLWTHELNSGARRLYEGLGFEFTGRRKPDEVGEPIVHYYCELPALPWIARPAARLVCLDPADRILLLHWRDPLDGYQLWEPPGGGIEPGETSYDAVLREWQEETGLPTPSLDERPTAVAREVIFNGLRSVVDEDFFLGRLPRAGDPRPDEATEAEQQAYLGHAWVPWRELDSLEDPVEPDLLPVLRRLEPDGPWATPAPS
jgi:8-oxo-dGTP pyrophosphatase MutT (NUDIX family)/GNAT superfamily N-acetyltransferase